MKTEDLKQKTTEKLESELKGNKIIAWALIGVLIPLFAVTLYGLISNKSSSDLPLLVVAILCGAYLPILLNTIKKIKKELNSRNVNE